MTQIVDPRPQQIRLDGYGRASLLLAWSFPRVKPPGVRVATLIFARLELLPDEIPGPTSHVLVEAGRAQRPAWAAVVEMEIADAVAWYEQVRQGHWSFPPKLAAKLGPPPPTRTLSGLQEEPRWPSLVLLPTRPVTFPFLTSDLACPRTHHVFSDALHSEAWTDNELKQVSAAVAPALQFALHEHRMLFGSAHLVLPNPILREIDVRLLPNQTGEHENIALRLVARRGASLGDLSVSVWERRDAAVQRLASFTPTEPFVRVEMLGQRSEVGVIVEHAVHGCIHDSVPAPFISSFHLNLGLLEAERRVSIDRGAKGVHQYSVSPSRRDRDVLAGEPAPSSALRQIREARTMLETGKHVARLDEVFFHREWDRAHSELELLIGGARRLVRFVDYFFSGNDAALVVPAVASLDARIEILSSKEGLGIVAGRGRSTSDAARDLVDALDDLSSRAKMQAVDARVMRGETADIHDRFLQIDDQVFLLGSSLNEYGSRGTMLVRLRYPELVTPRLDAAWSGAEDLRAFASRSPAGTP